MRQGETHWYGFGFTTNSGYQPFDGLFNFNNIFSAHSGGLVGASQAPVNLLVARYGPANGANMWTASTPLARLSAPRLAVCVYGGDAGDSNWPNEDGRFTARCYLGPVFQAAHLYRVQMRAKWDAYMSGSLEMLVDGTSVVNASGISTLWQRNGQVDNDMYPIFENYRGYTTTLGTTDVYYGGLILGSTQTDVTVP
jgi:hypothetical protein